MISISASKRKMRTGGGGRGSDFSPRPTLFAELGEEVEAGDGRPCEDDGVLAGDVLAQLLCHQAVELRFVLQGGQTVGTLTLLQVHRDLLGETHTCQTLQLHLSFNVPSCSRVQSLSFF